MGWCIYGELQINHYTLSSPLEHKQKKIYFFNSSIKFRFNRSFSKMENKIKKQMAIPE